MVEKTSSLIPFLEPLLGAGLALNLAYLYLQWFYYLQSIGEAAVSARNVASDSSQAIIEGNPDNHDTGCINYLASLGVDVPFGSQQPYPCKLPFKSTLWAIPMFILFIKKLDRYVAMLGSALIMTLIVVGVAHDLGLYKSVLTSQSEIMAHWVFHLCTLAFIWPVAMAVIAHFIKKSVQGYVQKSIGALAMLRQKSAVDSFGEAPLPPDVSDKETPTI